MISRCGTCQLAQVEPYPLQPGCPTLFSMLFVAGFEVWWSSLGLLLSSSNRKNKIEILRDFVLRSRHFCAIPWNLCAQAAVANLWQLRHVLWMINSSKQFSARHLCWVGSFSFLVCASQDSKIFPKRVACEPHL